MWCYFWLTRSNQPSYRPTYTWNYYLHKSILSVIVQVILSYLKLKTSKQMVEAMWFRGKNFSSLEISRPRFYSSNWLYDLGVVIMPFYTTFSLAINFQWSIFSCLILYGVVSTIWINDFEWENLKTLCIGIVGDIITIRRSCSHQHDYYSTLLLFSCIAGDRNNLSRLVLLQSTWCKQK